MSRTSEDSGRAEIAQFRYFKIQPETIDITARLWGINPTNSLVYSPEPRTEVYCFRLNFNISKLGYWGESKKGKGAGRGGAAREK